MQYLKANTQTIVTIGPFVDVGDGFTPETGVALSTADEAELLKHGSTTVVDISAATWAAVTSADGYYSLTLTTSHTDTEGQLTVMVNDDSVCLPVIARFQVLAEAAYDSLFAAKDTGLMDVNVSAVGDTTQTAGDLAALVTTVDGVVDSILVDTAELGAAVGASLSADIAAIKAETALIVADTNALQTDWADGGRLDLILDAILVDTDVIGAAGAGLTSVGVVSLSSAAITDVWSTDALVESYAADGAAGTAAQILYLIQQSLTEFAISSTTITAKKLDGSTTAATYTLDDATTPTSRTRAS